MSTSTVDERLLSLQGKMSSTAEAITTLRQRPITKLLGTKAASLLPTIVRQVPDTVTTSSTKVAAALVRAAEVEAKILNIVATQAAQAAQAEGLTATNKTGLPLSAPSESQVKFSAGSSLVQIPHKQAIQAELVKRMFSDIGSEDATVPLPDRYAEALKDYAAVVTSVCLADSKVETTTQPHVSSSETAKRLADRFELADLLDDRSYFQVVIKQLFESWDTVYPEFMKVKLDQELLDKIVVNFPFIYLPLTYHTNKKFILSWLQNNGLTTTTTTTTTTTGTKNNPPDYEKWKFEPKVVVLNGVDYYYNNVSEVHSDLLLDNEYIQHHDSSVIPFISLTSYGIHKRINPITSKLVEVTPITIENSTSYYIYDEQADFPLRNMTVAGMKIGLWQRYTNGKLKRKGYYFNGKEHGPWETYNFLGGLERSQVYEHGQAIEMTRYHGSSADTNLPVEQESYHENGDKTSRLFHSNGKLNTLTTYNRHDIKSGPFEQWLDNGYPRFIGNYVNNKRDGVWHEYYGSTGALKSSKTYKMDVGDGPYCEYYSNGVVRLEGSYVSGKKHGLWKSYHMTNVSEKWETYKTGVLEGPYVDFYGSGFISETGSYVNGQKVPA